MVWDAHLGGWPVAMIGIESRPLQRRPAARGRPEQWTSGTLFPQSSRKIARAINSVGGRRRGGAGQPRRLRRVAGVDGQLAARVRRRDRPGGRELRRADRLLRGLALPRRSLRGLLAAPERAAGGGGARGLTRLGYRRGARRRRRLRSGGQAAHGAGAANRRARRTHRGRVGCRTSAAAAEAGRGLERGPRRGARPAGGRVRLGPFGGASAPDGLDQPHHPAQLDAPVPHRGRGTRHASRARPAAGGDLAGLADPFSG